MRFRDIISREKNSKKEKDSTGPKYIEFNRIVNDYKKYWRLDPIERNVPTIQVGEGKDNLQMLGCLGESGRERCNKGFDEVEELLECVSSIDSDLIALPNGMIENVSYNNWKDILSKIDDIYKKYLENQVLVLGIDFNEIIKNSNGLGLVMVYVRGKNKNKSFNFYQCKSEERIVDDERAKKINRELKIKIGGSVLDVLFLSCGEIFLGPSSDGYFQNDKMDVVIDLAHANDFSDSDKPSMRMNDWRKRLEDCLKEKNSCGFTTINDVYRPDDIEISDGREQDLPKYTVATKTQSKNPNVLKIDDFTFRLEHYNLKINKQ